MAQVVAHQRLRDGSCNTRAIALHDNRKLWSTAALRALRLSCGEPLLSKPATTKRGPALRGMVSAMNRQLRRPLRPTSDMGPESGSMKAMRTVWLDKDESAARTRAAFAHNPAANAPRQVRRDGACVMASPFKRWAARSP